MVNDGARRECADGGTEAICHQHEETLTRGAQFGRYLVVHKQAARYVEEVEGHSIDDAGEDEEDDAREGGVAHAEETKAQHPGHHGNEHHLLDAEAAQEEGDEQDAQGLGNLRERNEERGIVGRKTVGVFRLRNEMGDEGASIAVGHLQGHTQQHGEDEEEGHTLFAEEAEGVQSQHLRERTARFALDKRAGGEREAIEEQQDAESYRHNHRAGFNLREEGLDDLHIVVPYEEEDYPCNQQSNGKAYPALPAMRPVRNILP